MKRMIVDMETTIRMLTQLCTNPNPYCPNLSIWQCYNKIPVGIIF